MELFCILRTESQQLWIQKNEYTLGTTRNNEYIYDTKYNIKMNNKVDIQTKLIFRTGSTILLWGLLFLHLDIFIASYLKNFTNQDISK